MSQFSRRLQFSIQFFTGRRPAQEVERSGGSGWTWLPAVGDSAGSHRIMGRAAAALVCLTVWLLLNVVSVEAKRKQTPVVPPDLKILSVVVSPESFTPGESSLSFIIEVELPKELAGSTLLEVSSLISSPSKRSLRFLTSRQPVGPGGARGPVASSGATDAGDESVSRPGPVAAGPPPTEMSVGSAPPGAPAEQAPGGTGADAEPSADPSREPVAGPESVGAGVGVGGVAAGPPSTQDESMGGPEHESPEARDIRMTITLAWDGNDQTGQRVLQGRFDYEVRAKLLVVGESGPRTQMVSWPKRGTIEVR